MSYGQDRHTQSGVESESNVGVDGRSSSPLRTRNVNCAVGICTPSDANANIEPAPPADPPLDPALDPNTGECGAPAGALGDGPEGTDCPADCCWLVAAEIVVSKRCNWEVVNDGDSAVVCALISPVWSDAGTVLTLLGASNG